LLADAPALTSVAYEEQTGLIGEELVRGSCSGGVGMSLAVSRGRAKLGMWTVKEAFIPGQWRPVEA